MFDRIPKAGIQLIVTSNDRFLMNTVDIKHWNVLERKKSIVECINYHSHKDIFEEFIFTGLNNFDFFSTKFYQGEID